MKDRVSKYSWDTREYNIGEELLTKWRNKTLNNQEGQKGSKKMNIDADGKKKSWDSDSQQVNNVCLWNLQYNQLIQVHWFYFKAFYCIPQHK